jgi:hypothetical protein
MKYSHHKIIAFSEFRFQRSKSKSEFRLISIIQIGIPIEIPVYTGTVKCIFCLNS